MTKKGYPCNIIVHRISQASTPWSSVTVRSLLSTVFLVVAGNNLCSRLSNNLRRVLEAKLSSAFVVATSMFIAFRKMKFRVCCSGDSIESQGCPTVRGKRDISRPQEDSQTLAHWPTVNGKLTAQLMELPNEILHAILIILVMSYDGARDLARVSTTSCAELI